MTVTHESHDAEMQIVEQSKRIGYSTVEYTVEFLADKLSTNEFYIPEYQRASVWEPDRKSRFIESLLLGLPIPFLFFWENEEDGRLEIVDGSQRIRTIREFLDGELTLGELEVLSKSSGFSFGDLTEARQRKFKNRTIRGVVLDDQADDQARADLFDRINTGSKDANPAEIRRGAIPGPFTDLVTELATSELFVQLTPMSEMAVNSRTREELVSRFFALSGDLEGYRDRVSDFLFDFSREITDQVRNQPELVDVMRKEFTEAMEFISDNFPYGFKRARSGTSTPKTRYEAIAIGTKQALALKPNLSVREDSVEELVSSEDFSAIVRADGGNAKNRVQQRIAFIRNGLLERQK
ncbi:DUF262 domain-containing protein [Rhodococcus zopfii]|uniref:DUF262 domain-containing protein n=1 Tax=Rhodococcus zopfii TaxID=43772 RepID=A0ABU3WS27_9NOCA|nr:DUF262 domain-containing protein [Rhodococcus zopfii]